MRFHNLDLATEPLFLHANGRSKQTEEWKDLVEHSLGQVSLFPPDVTFVTYAAGPDPSPVLDQLERSGAPVVNAAAGTPRESWQNRKKIPLLLQAMLEIDTTWVCSVDGHDVLPSEDLRLLTARLGSLDLLFSVGTDNFPPGLPADAEGTPFKYLNSGLFVGRRTLLQDFYGSLLEAVPEDGADKYWDRSDQLRVRPAWRRWRGIGMDSRCEVFQNLPGCEFMRAGEDVDVHVLALALSRRPRG